MIRRPLDRRIDNVRARLLKSPHRFAELAMKYSECTTAVNGGLLGAVERSELYPELERSLRSLSKSGNCRVWLSRQWDFM